MGSKGDLFDGIMWANSLKNGQGEPEQISDYPEHVVGILRCFYETFGFPGGAIPYKNKKGYKNWVLQLEELSKLFTTPERTKMAMERANKLYNESPYKPLIYQPLSIKSFLIEAVRQLRQELKNKIAETPPQKQPEITSDTEEAKKVISELKHLLRKDD